MCNLYNITTNQVAIIALFRVVNLCWQSAANARCLLGLSGTTDCVSTIVVTICFGWFLLPLGLPGPRFPSSIDITSHLRSLVMWPSVLLCGCAAHR
jgi:hypothetical protein